MNPGSVSVDLLIAVREAIVAGNSAAAESAAAEALARGVEPQAIVADGLTPALGEVGRLFEQGEYFLPELLVAARATKAIFDVLRPLLARRGAAPVGRVALGTVRGDMHDIGKSIVGAVLEGAGFEVVDLGVDVPPERFVAVAAEGRVDVVGISALLTSTLPSMREAVEALTASRVRPAVRVIVGGAPVTPAFAASIGADAYGASAAAAVDVVRGLMEAHPV
jgi:5-methyltetrahydrofolate--homocysteine methyltransferase